MLKRSASERSCPDHVRVIGVKVLPSVFQRPALRVTGLATGNNVDSNGHNGHGACSDQPSGSSPISEADEKKVGASWDSAPPHHIDSRSIDDIDDFEELTESERDLKIDYQISRANQLIEHDKRLQEKLGLDELLKVCTDYEKQALLEKTIAQTRSLRTEKRSSLRLCSITKIKTNGTLTSSSAHARRCSEPSKPQNSNDSNSNSNSNVTQLRAEKTPKIDQRLCKNSAVDDDIIPKHACSHFLFPERHSPDRAHSIYDNAQNGETVKPFHEDPAHSCLSSRSVTGDDHEPLQHRASFQEPETFKDATKPRISKRPLVDTDAGEMCQGLKTDLVVSWIESTTYLLCS